MSRVLTRRHGHGRMIVFWLLAMAAMLVLGVAEFIMSRAVVFVPLAAAAIAGAYLAGHRHGSLRPSGRAQTRRLADARRLRQAAELEGLAGRSLDEICESYRAIARRHQGGQS